MNLETYKSAVKNCKLGKKLPDALYIHRSALQNTGLLNDVATGAQERASKEIPGLQWNLVKFHRYKMVLSLLWYPHFDSEAHPALHQSVVVNLFTGEMTRRNYASSKNPPILHRKELFLIPGYPLFNDFERLTEQEEDMGLLKECSKVGFRNQWLERCSSMDVSFDGNKVKGPLVNEEGPWQTAEAND
jgi:DNA phosphorothioation-associated putative methyltransferase